MSVQAQAAGRRGEPAEETRPGYALRPPLPVRRQWPVHLLGSTSAGLVATGAAPIAVGGGSPVMTVAASASAGLAAGWTVLAVRRQRRAEIEEAARATLERVTGQLTYFRVRHWRGRFVGVPRRIRFRYQPAGVLNDKGKGVWPATGVAILAAALGGRYAVARHDSRRGTISLRWVPAPVERFVDAREERAGELMKQLFGQAAEVSSTITDDVLSKVTVRHDCGIKATFASWRERVGRVVSTMLEGRWRARWDLESDSVVFELRPEMPRYAERPAPVVDPAHPDFFKIPLGVDEDHNVVYWDLASSMPHFLVSGKTGKGKTTVLRGVVMELAARQLKVWLIDPKRVELIALRDWANVQLVATVIEQQVATVLQAWKIMEERYAAIEAGASEEDFEMLVIVLDEFAEFSRRVAQWWARIKRQGMPAVCPVFEAFDSLVRLGRTARIRIAIGIQRPDARFFGESAEARDNFDSRLSLGRLSPDGSRMMWGSMVGTSLPGVNGRAIACTSEDEAAEIQTYWIPDPRRLKVGSDPGDRAALERMRPATATHEPLQIVIPEPALDDKKRPLVWEAINDAVLEPAGPERDTDLDLHEATGRDGLDTEEAPDGPATNDQPDGRPATPPVTGAAPSGGARVRPSKTPAPSRRASPSRVAAAGRSGTVVPFRPRQPAQPADDYGPVDEVPAADVADGDLILVDDRWVVVEAAEPDPLTSGAVALAWRSVDDGDDDGTETVSADHTLSRRSPLDD